MCNPIIEGLCETLKLAIGVAPVTILVGERQHDRFVAADADGRPRIVSLDGLISSAVDVDAQFRYEPAKAEVSLFKKKNEHVRLQDDSRFPTEKNATSVVVKTELIERFLSLNVDAPMRALLIVDAGLLFETPAQPSGEDHSLLQALELFGRKMQSSYRVVLLTPNLSRLPSELLDAAAVRVVNMPAAERDERVAYCRLRGARLAEQCDSELAPVAAEIARMTDGWRLVEIEALIHLAERASSLHAISEIEPLARAYRFGVARTPWAGAEIRAAIAGAAASLSQRVRGQPAAIEAVVKRLRKAITGLSGAHQSGLARGPRAVFFFAGPTGTGKTEMAKAVAALIYGDESAMHRFDCSEFTQEHSIARLLGAPPGYVGHDRGSELVERIRAKPFSILLFDEIEKGSSKLFDIFLSIIDDGRITDSQGVTADFSESILIFTSNLGVYTDLADEHGNVIRRPNFEYDTPYSAMADAIRISIGDYFIQQLGRPELLGRLGGVERGIQVFDSLRDIAGVAEKFLANIAATVKRLHAIKLVTDQTVIDLITRDAARRPEALVLGARGLAQSVEALFSEPLADLLANEAERDCTLHARCDNGQVIFHRE